MEPIGVNGFIRPDTSNKHFSIDLHENVLINTLVKRLIAGVRSERDSRIDDRHEFHVLLVKAANEVRKASEQAGVSGGVLGVVGEVSIVLHVVNINPLVIKWNVIINISLS